MKLVTNLKEKVKNTLCVAEEIKNELLSINQEAKHRGKALKAVVRSPRKHVLLQKQNMTGCLQN